MKNYKKNTSRKINLLLRNLQALQIENDSLKKTLDKIQSQLDTSLDAQVGKTDI